MCGRYILRQLEKSEKHWKVYGPPDWVRMSYNDLLPIDECQKAISVARHWVMMNP